MSLPNHFELLATDGQARTGRLTTPHGVVRTPAFMPVGTAGAMKGVHWREVREAGSDIVLGNTYHLMLRPGAERIAALGGLQRFTGWNGPMLTDSGGFQVMSLSELRKLSEQAVTFRSHIDGAKVELSPERSIEVQRLLGSDIAMQLDECVRLPAERADIERAMQLSLRWAERCKRAFAQAPPGYMLFGIVQGGDVPALRQASARGLVEIGFHGYAIGGLAVGEPQAVMLATIEQTVPALPRGPAALSDGGRHARGYSGGGRARHRHVRLRDADPQRAARRGLHPVRPDQPAQRAPCRRSAAARRGEPVAIGADIRAGLPASPRQVRRDAGRDAAVGNQYRLLPGTDAGHARGDRQRHVRGVSRDRRAPDGRAAISIRGRALREA